MAEVALQPLNPEGITSSSPGFLNPGYRAHFTGPNSERVLPLPAKPNQETQPRVGLIWLSSISNHSLEGYGTRLRQVSIIESSGQRPGARLGPLGKRPFKIVGAFRGGGDLIENKIFAVRTCLSIRGGCDQAGRDQRLASALPGSAARTH